jgi:hypothetical protein
LEYYTILLKSAQVFHQKSEKGLHFATGYDMMFSRFTFGGFIMAHNNRYRQFDFIATRVVIGDAFIFLLYLLCAAAGIGFLKGLCAFVAIVGSALCIGYLYLTQELLKKRSLWMTLSFGAIALLTIVSLLCKVPFGPVA